MREQITMYRDMYEFYKDTKSKRLFVAFAEYLFEGIEPTDLKGIEKTIFNSLKIRMKNQRKKANSGAIGGASSHGGGRPRNTSSELKEETSKKQTEKQTNEQAKNKEDNNTNVLLLSNILSYDNIYSAYYGKRKGIDEKICSKLIDNLIKQGTTLDQLYKCMVLYNSECMINQEWRYVMKLENRLKQFQPLTDDEIDSQLYTIVKSYRDKKKSDEKFGQSTPAKTLWDSLKTTFGEEKVKGMLKQANAINLTFT